MMAIYFRLRNERGKTWWAKQEGLGCSTRVYSGLRKCAIRRHAAGQGGSRSWPLGHGAIVSVCGADEILRRCTDRGDAGGHACATMSMASQPSERKQKSAAVGVPGGAADAVRMPKTTLADRQ